MSSRRIAVVSFAGVVCIAIAVAALAMLGGGSSTPPLDPARSVGESPRQVTGTAQEFPSEATTGVPAGTDLKPYDGPCAITINGTTIDASIVTCDRLVIQASAVLITKSQVGRIDLDDAEASLTIEDSEIDGGQYIAPAVGYYNITVRRSEVRGGATSVLCGSNCLIEDSLLHDQATPQSDEHLGGYLSNGGRDVIVRRNSIECTPGDNGRGGGCTGDAQIFRDFGPVSNYRFEANLFRATPGGYCASFGFNPGSKFSEEPTGIVVVSNVFERGDSGKCGVFGPATSFLASGAGNIWSDNAYDDGETIPPP